MRGPFRGTEQHSLALGAADRECFAELTGVKVVLDEGVGEIAEQNDHEGHGASAQDSRYAAND